MLLAECHVRKRMIVLALFISTMFLKDCCVFISHGPAGAKKTEGQKKTGGT